MLVNAWLISTKTGISRQLKSGDTRVGRAPDNDVILADDRTISRHHAIIRQQGASYLLIPQAAQVPIELNGILLDGITELKHQDIITFGETQYNFITSNY